MEMQIVKYDIMMKKKNNVKPCSPWRVLLECCLTATLVFCFHWNPGETVRSKEQMRLALNGHNTTISTSTTITIGATISSTNHWNITNTIKTTYSWQQSFKDVFFRMFQNLPLNPGKRITLKEKKTHEAKKTGGKCLQTFPLHLFLLTTVQKRTTIHLNFAATLKRGEVEGTYMLSS